MHRVFFHPVNNSAQFYSRFRGCCKSAMLGVPGARRRPPIKNVSHLQQRYYRCLIFGFFSKTNLAVSCTTGLKCNRTGNKDSTPANTTTKVGPSDKKSVTEVSVSRTLKCTGRRTQSSKNKQKLQWHTRANIHTHVSGVGLLFVALPARAVQSALRRRGFNLTCHTLQ